MRTADAVWARPVASLRTTPFQTAAVTSAEATVNHLVTAGADGNAVLINRKMFRILEIPLVGVI